MHIHQVCINHAVFITFTFRSNTKKEFFWSLSVITAKNEKENQVDITVRIRYLAISRKVIRKSAPDNPERYVGSPEFTVFQRNLKKRHERPWASVCEC